MDRTHGFRPSGFKGFLRGLMASALESFGGAEEEEGAAEEEDMLDVGRVLESWDGS